MGLMKAMYSAAVGGDKLYPRIATSASYKHWISTNDLKRCLECASNHGKIYFILDDPVPKPPVHPKCRCVIKPMQTIKAGTATINGVNGADWMLMFQNCLPDCYVSQKELELLGWRRGDKISKFTTNKMLSGGIYKNNNHHLPHTAGRVWYEADINYKSGKRNSQRILWSNDGLIFVTYDHYETFYEVI